MDQFPQALRLRGFQTICWAAEMHHQIGVGDDLEVSLRALGVDHLVIVSYLPYQIYKWFYLIN